MKKAYISIPGHFCFTCQVRRDHNPQEEKRRVQTMVMQAIEKYFTYNRNQEHEYRSEQE